MAKPRIASSGESYLLRRAEQAEAELAAIRARLEAWGADATIQLDATHRVTVSTAAMVEEAISAATNWQDNAERAGVRVAELERENATLRERVAELDMENGALRRGWAEGQP